MKFCTCIGVTHTVLSLFGICCWTNWWYIWAVTGKVIIPLIPTGKTERKRVRSKHILIRISSDSPLPSSLVIISWPSWARASDKSTCMFSDCPSICTVWTVVPSLWVWSWKTFQSAISKFSLHVGTYCSYSLNLCSCSVRQCDYRRVICQCTWIDLDQRECSITVCLKNCLILKC